MSTPENTDATVTQESAPVVDQPQQQEQKQQQQKQQQPKKQKQQQQQPQQKKPSVNKKDFTSVFANTFPTGTAPYVDSHCHIDAILDRLNSAIKGKEAKKGCCGEEAPAAEADPNLQLWDLARLNKESHIGAWDGCVTVCCEPETYEAAMEVIDTDTTGKIYGAFGIHPHEAKKWTDEIQAKFEKAMEHPKVLAWGECGLDFYYNLSESDVQKEVFIKQIALAVKHKKPLVVHTREAEEETVEILIKHAPKDMKIHIHCCTSSPKMVEPLIEHFPNLFVGFTGCITFKNADAVQQTVAVVPIDRLLLETDGPYMAPMPFRGAVAHSGMIPFTAVKMAEIKGVELDVLLKQVRENTRKMYGF